MRSIILLFVLCLTMISDVLADESDRFGCNDGVLSVGFTNTGVMYHDGKGVDVDLLSLLSEKTGCTLQFIPIAREDAFNLVAEGDIDIVPSVTREPHRESFAWFIPYYQIRFLLLANADRLPLISDLEQLKNIEGVTLARASGSGYGTYFNYHLSEMESLDMVQFYPDYGETVLALLHGEVDATLSLPQIYRMFFAQGEEPLPLRIMDVSPANPIAVSLMLSKQTFSSAQVANWLRVMETLHLDGSLKRIFENYVSTDEAASMLGLSSHLTY